MRWCYQNSELSPEVKSWIDSCLVPILVKEYLKQSKKTIAIESAPMPKSVAVITDGLEVSK
jgi:hypothetical protein